MKRYAAIDASWALLLAIAVLVPAATLAQEPPAAKPCDSEAHRQFDFWVGDWEVTNAAGEVAGTNRIDKILDGCVLQEHWQGARGMRGESYNIYDARGERWHQTWVDTTGRLLELDGGMEGGRMVLSGDGIAGDGKPVHHEVSWEKLPDGRVKQHWRITRDGGETWQDVFLGFYAKKG